MKANVLNINGEKVKSIELPSQFNEEYRPDLIKRAVWVIQNNKRQAYGAFERAGKDYSAKLSRRRKHYKTSYGHGISRVPRKTLWHRGAQFGWVGALAPGTVGGRRAHPPKAGKIWEQKINKKERRKAIRSAIAATALKDILNKNIEVPLIVENKLESLNKTKDVEKFLIKLGLENELERLKIKNIRAGRGKLRGRRYKRKRGPLIVISGECKLLKSACNIPGVNIVEVKNLNAELLVQGLNPRLTIWTENSIEKLKNENLFLGKPSKKNVEKKVSEKERPKEIKKNIKEKK